MPVFEDFFQEPLTVNLEDHTPDIGAAWTTRSGVALAAKVFVSGGSRLRLGSTTDSLITSDDLANADCQVEFELGQIQTNNDSYIVLRAQDNQNFIGARMAGTGSAGLRLCKVVLGVITDLVNTQGTIGVKYKITAEGTTIKFFADGVQVGADQSVTDFQTETLQGVKVGNSSTTDWLVYYSADVISSGGATVTANSGTYLYNGTDAKLTSARILTANSGAYNYTGTSVNLLKGFILTADAGSYSYLGQDVTLTYTPAGAFTLTAGAGNYTYTGTDINFNRDRVIIMSSGTYNYNGTDIQIILPGQIWTDKPSVSTNWGNQTNVTTIWTDK